MFLLIINILITNHEDKYFEFRVKYLLRLNKYFSRLDVSSYHVNFDDLPLTYLYIHTLQV